jgi:hypothetical protein
MRRERPSIVTKEAGENSSTPSVTKNSHGGHDPAKCQLLVRLGDVPAHAVIDIGPTTPLA